jgi:hypothetical protein
MEAPNGIDSWIETHHEIVQEITLRIYSEEPDEDSIVHQRYEEQGTGGMYELAIELTDAFELEYEGAEWGESLNYYDTLENFLSGKL